MHISSSLLLRNSLIISLEDLLDLALARDTSTALRQYKIPHVSIPLALGLKLKELDKEETLYHIELPQGELNPAKDRCILWELGDWQTSYQSYQRKKDESRRRVEEWDRRKRNHATLMKHLKEMLFVDAFDNSQDDFLSLKASAILSKPADKLAAFCEQHHITLE